MILDKAAVIKLLEILYRREKSLIFTYSEKQKFGARPQEQQVPKHVPADITRCVSL